MYRTAASDEATIEELRQENARLKERLEGKRAMRREKRREWWKKKRGAMLPISIGGSAVCLIIYGVVASEVNKKARDLDFYDAQIACMPGWIEQLGNGHYQYRAFNPRVICTDGKKRWIVNREEQRPK